MEPWSDGTLFSDGTGWTGEAASPPSGDADRLAPADIRYRSDTQYTAPQFDSTVTLTRP